MLKIQLHSQVSLITNSSTVIYTYQGKGAGVELINEILSLMGEDKKAEDIFHIGLFCDDNAYIDYVTDEMDEAPEGFPENYEGRGKWFEDLQRQVLTGEIKEPEWFSDAEGHSGWSGYDPPTYLTIEAKDEKYKELGEKLISFLNSSDHEAFRDG